MILWEASKICWSKDKIEYEPLETKSTSEIETWPQTQIDNHNFTQNIFCNLLPKWPMTSEAKAIDIQTKLFLQSSWEKS